MCFSPMKLRNQSQFKEDFSTYLDCNPNLREGEELKKSELLSDVSPTNFQLFNNICHNYVNADGIFWSFCLVDILNVWLNASCKISVLRFW